MEHQGAIAGLGHRAQVVRDVQDGAAAPADRADAIPAPGLEPLVAHRQHLVDEEDVGLDVGRDGNPRWASMPELALRARR
jgi:hypothetical protein